MEPPPVKWVRGILKVIVLSIKMQQLGDNRGSKYFRTSMMDTEVLKHDGYGEGHETQGR